MIKVTHIVYFQFTFGNVRIVSVLHDLSDNSMNFVTQYLVYIYLAFDISKNRIDHSNLTIMIKKETN